MNIQALMQQANKMKREMEKKQQEISNHVFSSQSGGGAVKIEMKGSHEIVSLKIDSDAVDPEDVEMLEEMITLAINDVNKQIDEAFEAINRSLNIPF